MSAGKNWGGPGTLSTRTGAKKGSSDGDAGSAGDSKDSSTRLVLAGGITLLTSLVTGLVTHVLTRIAVADDTPPAREAAFLLQALDSDDEGLVNRKMCFAAHANLLPFHREDVFRTLPWCRDGGVTFPAARVDAGGQVVPPASLMDGSAGYVDASAGYADAATSPLDDVPDIVVRDSGIHRPVIHPTPVPPERRRVSQSITTVVERGRAVELTGFPRGPFDLVLEITASPARSSCPDWYLQRVTVAVGRDVQPLFGGGSGMIPQPLVRSFVFHRVSSTSGTVPLVFQWENSACRGIGYDEQTPLSVVLRATGTP